MLLAIEIFGSIVLYVVIGMIYCIASDYVAVIRHKDYDNRPPSVWALFWPLVILHILRGWILDFLTKVFNKAWSKIETTLFKSDK